jgi:hypothetical protein
MKWAAFGLVAASVALTTSASRDSIQDVETNLRPVLPMTPRDVVPRPAVIQNATTFNLFSRFFHHFDTRQAEGRCGQSAGGAQCPNNQCCSTFDFCGTDPEYVKQGIFCIEQS